MKVIPFYIDYIKHVQNRVSLEDGNAKLVICANNFCYDIIVVDEGKEIKLGWGDPKYLSSEVAEGFTGVIIALYAVNGKAEFENFDCLYE